MKAKRKKRRVPESRRSKADPTAPSTWSRRDKLVVMLWILIAALVFGSGPLLESYVNAKNELALRLARWKQAKHLNDDQVERLRQVELEFHGTANPFSGVRRHTHEESDAHHVQVAALLRAGSPPVLSVASLDSEGDD